LAAGFAFLGLKRGDRIAIMLPNLPQFPIVYYALLKLGVWAVPINVLFKETEIQQVAHDSEVDGFVAWEGFSRNLLPAIAALKKCRLHVFWGENVPPNAVDLKRLIATSVKRFELAEGGSNLFVDPTDPAIVLYTAGATGAPKGVVLSHGNLAAATLACWKNFAITQDNRFLAVVPLFHFLGQMMAIHLPLAAGATTFLLPRFDPREVVETIAREKITHYIAVPSMLPAILQFNPEPALLASLKCCIVGGGTLRAEVRNALVDRYHVSIYEGYGLAECGPFVTAFNATTSHSPEKACSVGTSLPGLEATVFNDTGGQMPDGRVGEIFVRAPWAMQGYLQNGQISKHSREDNWLATGDLGIVDGDGYLFWVDRKVDVIHKAGFPVYPSEVEAILLLHPHIEECAVIGVPDRVCGEEVKAVVVLRPNQRATKEELLLWCRQSLASYKCPQQVEFRERLPRSVTGKVLKYLLHEQKPAPTAQQNTAKETAKQNNVAAFEEKILSEATPNENEKTEVTAEVRP
jgi:long-chain acyl-CoA synthetase